MGVFFQAIALGQVEVIKAVCDTMRILCFRDRLFSNSNKLWDSGACEGISYTYIMYDVYAIVL